MPKTTSLVSIVDDDHSVCRALGRLVRLAGFTAETFASAEDFLISPFLEGTACLVLDIHLNGGMSGFALQARLVADRVIIPIIFITAHDDVSLRERAEALVFRPALERQRQRFLFDDPGEASGAAAYLCKPFNDEVLLDAIRGALGGNGTPLDQGPIGTCVAPG